MANQEKCSVCQDVLHQTNVGLYQTPCGHSFHFGCFQQIVDKATQGRRIKCPNCRKPVAEVSRSRKRQREEESESESEDDVSVNPASFMDNYLGDIVASLILAEQERQRQADAVAVAASQTSRGRGRGTGRGRGRGRGRGTHISIDLGMDRPPTEALMSMLDIAPFL